MKRFRSLMAILLVVQLVFGLCAGAVFAQSSSNDINGHWAEDKINAWLEADLVDGYPDGSFKPAKTVTRAEFVKMVNQAFDVKLLEESSLKFTDVATEHWAYEQIKTAAAQGYVKGKTETTFVPNEEVTRQEAAVMLASLLNLKVIGDVTFKDADKVSLWAKESVDALVGKSILNGDKNGNVNPRQALSRAEAVVLLSNAVEKNETVFSTADTYGNEDTQTVIEGNVRITAASVKLLNTKITGNLVIDKAVGEGDVYLNKVEVLGDTIVQGGGENSIHVEDSIMVRIFADKATGKVRIVAIGSTTVQEVIIQSPVKLEESNVTDSGFNNVQISKSLPPNSEVSLVGHFASVNLLAAEVKVNIPSGSVDQFSVGEEAISNQVEVSKDAKILSLLLDIAAQFTGEGQIEKAVIGENAAGSEFANEPATIDGDKSKVVILPPVTIPDNSGNTSNSGSGSNTPSPTSTSTDATLHSITFNADIDLEMKKTNVPTSVTTDVYTFDAQHLDYIILVENDEQNHDVEFQLATDEDATVQVYVEQLNRYRGYYADETGKYNVSIDPSLTSTIHIEIISGNGVFNKSYSIIFQPNYVDIARDFYISRTNFNSIILNTFQVLTGDIVRVSVAAEDSADGESFSTDLIARTYTNVQAGSPGSVQDVIRLFTNDRSTIFTPASEQGTLNIEVIREGKVIGSGQYNYDLTPVTLEVMDSNVYTFSNWTTDDIILRDLESNDPYKIITGNTLKIDQAKFSEKYGAFTYYYAEGTLGSKSEAIVVEDINQMVKTVLYSGSSFFNNMTSHDSYFGYDPLSSDNIDGKYQLSINEVERLIYLFNEDKQLIKALVVKGTITSDNVGPHVELNVR